MCSGGQSAKYNCHLSKSFQIWTQIHDHRTIDPPPNRPEMQNEQCLERGGLKMLHVAQNLAQQNDKGWQQKVLSSVKQKAISHLSPHFKHVTNYPLSFQLLFDSDITDLPYTSRPGNSMEFVSWSFAAIPGAKSDVEVRLLNPSVAPTPATKWRLIDLFFAWAEKFKIWNFDVPSLKILHKVGYVNFWVTWGFLIFEILQKSRKHTQVMPVEGRRTAEKPQ